MIILGGIIIIFLIIAAIIAIVLIYQKEKQQRQELYNEILAFLHLSDIDSFLCKYDDTVIVKSRQALINYDDIKYLKKHDCIDKVKQLAAIRNDIKKDITAFLQQNDFSERPQYDHVARQLDNLIDLATGYRILIVYITSAGNNRGERIISISDSRIKQIEAHPELLMTKAEYNRILKDQEKGELEAKRHEFYDRVNSIIDYANNAKDTLIVKARATELDELIQKLLDTTIHNIQKVKQIDSGEWDILKKIIIDIEKQTRIIVDDDRRIGEYYASDDFVKIKEICSSLNQSRKDFNEYIDEKAQSISKLFGTRIVRNETLHEDTYSYIRPYKKSITPFTAEVSAAVFSSAENDPINYIVKYFYSDKSQYKEQIQKLKTLIEELETLQEAKVIIENYKKDYELYIQNVPSYVLEEDEDGFYSRLGLAVINEAILNVEYRFTYTSPGGKAKRSFTVPMSEENIIALITALENTLTMKALAKEQRAMMTAKLRLFIKERDHFTCRICGNSTTAEPNLLLEVDHIIPIAKGGPTIEDNLQTLCWKCNRSKGAKMIS